VTQTVDDDRFVTETSLDGSGGAVFSADERYRYRLWRIWDPDRPRLLAVMCNPSTATATKGDPTVSRVVKLAQRDGFGSLEVANAYAIRSPDPRLIYLVDDPVGPDNDEQILAAAATADAVLCAWGVHGGRYGRGDAVLALLLAGGARCHYLALTKNGHPKHPLYVRGDTPLTPYQET
jgi:hypothetical protein